MTNTTTTDEYTVDNFRAEFFETLAEVAEDADNLFADEMHDKPQEQADQFELAVKSSFKSINNVSKAELFVDMLLNAFNFETSEMGSDFWFDVVDGINEQFGDIDDDSEY